MYDPFAEFQMQVLDNGLTVYALQWPDRPFEALGIMVHSGALQDPIGLEGVAHFLEHIINREIKGMEELSVLVEINGGDLCHGSTSYFSTYFESFMPAEDYIFFNVLSAYKKALFGLQITEESFEIERQRIINEFYERYQTNTILEIDVLKCKALFFGSPLERFIRPMGKPESVNRIQKSDLEFFQRINYNPANISLVGVGKYSLEELVRFLKHSGFDESTQGERILLPQREKNIKPIQNRKVLYALNNANTAVFQMAAKLPGTINPMLIQIFLLLINELLNREMSKMNGKTYSVDCKIGDLILYHELNIKCCFSPEIADQVETIVQNCIDLANDPKLFNRFKKRLIGEIKLADINGHGMCNLAMQDLCLEHRIISYSEMVESIQSVTIEDIRMIIELLQPEYRWTMLSRP